ncbi:signal peptidase I [bacterium]|nr:signal peptidase I [bacterium]
MILIYLAIVLLMIASMWKVFTKAGKPGWASIVPIYNTIVLLEIVGKPIWWIILLLIPFVNIIVLLIVLNELSKSFGRGVGTTLGLIFLGFIFWPILGFGSAQYQRGEAAAA